MKMTSKYAEKRPAWFCTVNGGYCENAMPWDEDPGCDNCVVAYEHENPDKIEQVEDDDEA